MTCQSGHPGGLLLGFSTEAMVEMAHCQFQPQLLPPACQQVQQGHGVGAAGNRHQHPVSAAEELFLAHKAEDPIRQLRPREIGGLEERLYQAAAVGQSWAMTSRMASLEKGLARKRSTTGS